MSEVKSRAVVFETPTGDLELISKELAQRDCEDVLSLSWAEANKVFSNGASVLAVVPIREGDERGINLIEKLRNGRPEMPVIATGPSQTPDLILRAVRAGAVEYLVQPLDSADLGPALDRVLQTVGLRTKPGRCIAVYSAKGGLGSTTVAVNLAFALARSTSDARVALVDLVVQGGDVRIFLDIKPAHTITDLVEQLDSLDRHELQTLLHAYPNRVWVCADPNMPDEGELLSGPRVSGVVHRLTHDFDYTVVDCEHMLNERTLAVLDAAHQIVLLTHLTLPAVRSLQRTLDLFARLDYPADKVTVVVNRFGSKGDLTLSDLEKVLDRPVKATLPNDYRATIDAAARGQPLQRIAPKSKIASALDQLAHNLMGADKAGGGSNSKRPRFFRR